MPITPVVLLLAVTRGPAAAGSSVLAVLALLLILAVSAVAVALTTLVPLGPSVIMLVSPLRAYSAAGHPP